MSWLRLLSLLTVLLVSFLNSNYAEQLTVSGVKFGELETLLNISVSVLHMEEDQLIPGNILYSDLYSIWTTDGFIEWLIAGSPTDGGYVEAVGASARFQSITGFHHFNSSLLIIVDHNNHCLRSIDRVTKQTAPYLGKCTESGSADGVNPRFHYPWSIIADPQNPHILLVSEQGNHDVRSVDTLSMTVTTILTIGLIYPMSMRVSIDKTHLLITNNNYINSVDLKSKSPKTISGRTSAGHQDGELKLAQFNTPRDVVELVENSLLLVADRGTYTVRVVDLVKSQVSSICQPDLSGYKDGDAQTCQLYNPESLLFVNGTVYIGENRRIRKMKVYFNECSNSPCHAEANCTDLDPGYSCTCKPGYSGDGTHCEDVDKCSKSPCHPFADCVNHDGRFSCSCKAGFTGNGTNCQEEFQCPTEVVSLSADLKTRTGVFVFNLAGNQHKLYLSIGAHRYTINQAGKNCTLNITVRDPEYLIKRMNFQADYTIKCSLLESSNTKAFLKTMASYHYSIIKEICDGKCEKCSEEPLTLSCENDTLTVTWPTNVTFSGDIEKVPEHLLNTILSFLNGHRSILNLMVVNHIPPVIYPRVNKAGRAAEVVLTPFCKGGRQYHSVDGTCV